MKKPELLNGDCLDVLAWIEPNSIDALVTDPPAGISFMNKEWDHNKGGREQWVTWMTSAMKQAHAAMKPGAHGLIWALPRTSHWTATALGDAGFEVRDVITHLFGSGFPKSLNVSKAIDKAAGAEREVTRQGKTKSAEFAGKFDQAGSNEREKRDNPATDSAKQWDGWGTALKPASEHWILVRKPLSEKTVAANVLKWGTGAINIDASRIAAQDLNPTATQKDFNAMGYGGANGTGGVPIYNMQGRFPANLVLSHSPHCEDEQCDLECAVKMLDMQSGTLKSGQLKQGHKRGDGPNVAYGGGGVVTGTYGGDSGGASRFFYCAKISSSERNAGCEVNGHPTVKSKKLMSYLIKMVTPPNGTVLDPFMGSGSTGVAAKECGFDFIGIEKEAEYFEIAKKRIGHAKRAN